MIHKKHSKHGYQLTESTTIPIKAYADDVCRMCHDRQKLKELLQLTATYCGQRGVAHLCIFIKVSLSRMHSAVNR